MQSDIILYLYIFLIIPLLLFIGISILARKEQFRLFPLFSVIILVLVLIIHAHSIFHFTKSMFTGQKVPVQKVFGIFIIILALLLLFLNIYLLLQKKKLI
jgi:uncharacterized membrane protein